MSMTLCGEDLHFVGGRGQKEKNVAIGNVAWQDLRDTQPRRDSIIGVFKNCSLQFALHVFLGPGLSLKGGVHNQYIPKSFWNINVSRYRVFFVVFFVVFCPIFWCFVWFYCFFLWNVLYYSICVLWYFVLFCALDSRLLFIITTPYHAQWINEWWCIPNHSLGAGLFGKFGLAVNAQFWPKCCWHKNVKACKGHPRPDLL